MHDMRAASQKNRKIKNSCQCASSRKKRRGKKREQVFRIMSPRVMTRENRSKKFFLRVAASREERETRDVAFDYFFRVFVTPKKDKDFGSRFRATSASARGTRVTVRAKCRFARSFVAMSRSPLASAAGLACVFVLMFAPRADAWHPNPSKLLPYEHAPVRAASARATASRAGVGRWHEAPRIRRWHQWVRPPPTHHAPVSASRIAKRRLAPRATTPTSLPRNRARPPPVAHPSPPSRTTYAPVRCMQFTCEPYSWRISTTPEGAVADAVEGRLRVSRIKQLEKPKEEDLGKWCSRVASCATATDVRYGHTGLLPTTRRQRVLQSQPRSPPARLHDVSVAPGGVQVRHVDVSLGEGGALGRAPGMAPKMNCQCAIPAGCVPLADRADRAVLALPAAGSAHHAPAAGGGRLPPPPPWPPPGPSPPASRRCR